MGPEGARPRAGAGLSRASAYLHLGTWRPCRGCVGGEEALGASSHSHPGRELEAWSGQTS